MHVLFNNMAEIFSFLKIIYVIINPTSCLMQHQLLTIVDIQLILYHKNLNIPSIIIKVLNSSEIFNDLIRSLV